MKTSQRSCSNVIWNNRLGNRLGLTKQGHAFGDLVIRDLRNVVSIESRSNHIGTLTSFFVMLVVHCKWLLYWLQFIILRRGIIPYGRKKIIRKCYTNLSKKVISVPTILLSSSVEQKLAFHKDLQYLIRSSCLQGPKRLSFFDRVTHFTSNHALQTQNLESSIMLAR